MESPLSATLSIPSALLAQLREGHDLAISLSKLDPESPSAPRWLTTVRVHVSGHTLARSLEGRLLTLTLVTVPQISVPDLRWDPADPPKSR